MKSSDATEKAEAEDWASLEATIQLSALVFDIRIENLIAKVQSNWQFKVL